MANSISASTKKQLIEDVCNVSNCGYDPEHDSFVIIMASGSGKIKEAIKRWKFLIKLGGRRGYLVHKQLEEIRNTIQQNKFPSCMLSNKIILVPVISD